MLESYSFCQLVERYKIDLSEECLLGVLKKMEPIINKYARRLYLLEFEDMKQELSIAVIESINKIQKYDNEGQVVSYFCRAVRNRYLELCRKSEVTEKEDIYDEEKMKVLVSSSEDTYLYVELYKDLEKYRKGKTKIEKEIIKGVLDEEKTDTELAGELGISRQYVNRCKKRLFKELYSYLKDN